MVLGRRSVLTMLLSVACGTSHSAGDGHGDGSVHDTPSDGGRTDTGDGATDTPPGDGDAPDGGPADDSGRPTDGTMTDAAAGCEPRTLTQPAVPEVLLALDRSGSMNENDRWTHAVAAVKAWTSGHGTDLLFGLTTFPEPADAAECEAACADASSMACLECLLNAGGETQCLPGKLDVPVGAENAQAIADFLDNAMPSGGTPTGSTLGAALEYLQPDAQSKPTSAQYVVLVTDGLPTCPNGEGTVEATPEQLAADHALTIEALATLKKAHVNTYVIGYDALSLAEELEAYAAQGGTRAPRLPTDDVMLADALESVAREIVACSYDLEGPLAGKAPARVTLDGQSVARSDENGWTVVGTSLVFQGTACATLNDGKMHEVQAALACP